MPKLFVFGCSFSSLYNKSSIGDPDVIKYKDFRGGTLPPTWSELLAKDLGYELINTARWGANNYEIFEKFCLQVENMQKGDCVIVSWTDVSRFRLYSSKLETYVNLGTWAKEDRTILEDVSQKTMDELLVNRGHDKWVSEVKNWSLTINRLSTLIGFKLYYWSFFKSFPEYFIYDDMIRLGAEHITHETNGYIKNEHMGEKGHQTQCEFIKKSIDTKYPQKNLI